MKKLISLVLAAVMVLSLSVSAFAADNEHITAILDRNIKVTYNGELQTFTDVNGKIVYPVVYEGTTYLPVRAVSGLVSLPVEWDGANYTVVLGGDGQAAVPAAPVETPLTNSEIIHPVLDRNIKVTFDGELQTFTDVNGKVVYPIVYNGTTYLPVRAVSGLVNLPVEWDGANYTVVLGQKKDAAKLAKGVWNGNVYTNEFADIKYTANDNTRVGTEEEIAEFFGSPNSNNMLVDFLVADYDNKATISIAYIDYVSRIEEQGSAISFTEEKYFDAVINGYMQEGEFEIVNVGTTTLNGNEYLAIMLYSDNRMICQFHRVFNDRFVTIISITARSEDDIFAAASRFN